MRFFCPVCQQPSVYQHLPAGPLVELADQFREPERSGQQEPHGLRAVLGANDLRLYLRAAQAGCLTAPSADRLAVAFGEHPGNVWDDWVGLLAGAVGPEEPPRDRRGSDYWREYRRANRDRINDRDRESARDRMRRSRAARAMAT